MRSVFAVILVTGALVTGCSRSPPPAEAASGPRDRPLAQDGTTARAITSTPDRVKVQVDLSTVRGALQIFRGEHNAWPESLEALGVVGLNYPADLAYDAASGTVTSRTYPTY